jgi:hypothetical protein
MYFLTIRTPARILFSPSEEYGLEKMGAEYFSFRAGTVITELLSGLEDIR